MRFSTAARLRTATLRRFLGFAMSQPLFVRALSAHRSGPLGGAIDPDTAVILRLSDFTGEDRIAHLSPATARKRVAASIAVADAPPLEDVTVTELCFQGEGGDIPARLYTPEGLAASSPAIVYFHGGGFVTCDLDTHEGLCTRLARFADVRVVSVDYRLAPEHPFPAAVHDCEAAFQQVIARAAELGVDARRVAVMGDSAGGNLSAVVARRSRGMDCRPALVVLLYPTVDATYEAPSFEELAEGFYLTAESVLWYRDQYLGDREELRTDPDVSPGLDPDLTAMPATQLYVAGLDPLRDEALSYAAALEAQGCDVKVEVFDELIHGFALMTGVSARSSEAVVRMAKQVGRALRDEARA